MGTPLTDEALDQLFREARTFTKYHDKPVSQDQLEAIWGLMKMGPTSANQLPARLVWCTTPEAKQRLAGCCAPGNVDKVLAAPVSVIIAMDEEFHEQLPWLFPHTDARSWFTGDADKRRESAFRNSTLQGAYFILATRTLGLDCGPMSGFDNAKLDAEFFADQPSWKSNFISTLGYGDRDSLHPRSPRPDFGDFNIVA
jgi:3-hydroxypropanoate dehydrogenase